MGMIEKKPMNFEIRNPTFSEEFYKGALQTLTKHPDKVR